VLPSLYDSFLKGKEEAKEWQQHFQEVRNYSKVFEENFASSSPDVFFPTKESHRLIRSIGKIRNSVPFMTVIGPKRSGKSHTTQQIVRNINESEERKLKDEEKIKAIYKSYDENFWDWWDEADFSSNQIFFFDHIYPIWRNFTEQSFKDLLIRSKSSNILVVVILDSIEHYWLKRRLKSESLSIFGQKPHEFNFKHPSKSEIINIVKKRTEFIGKPHLLTSEVLTTLSTISLGLPGLVLWLCRHLISQSNVQEEKLEISTHSVHQAAEILGFPPALKLIEHNHRYTQQPDYKNEKHVWPILDPLKEALNEDSTTLLHYLEKTKGITKSWLPLLEEIMLLNHEAGNIRRSDLQERTGIKESSLTYQCQNLIKEKIINYSKTGREVFYELRSPIKEALELTFFG
jgi:hypothetical protein